jgi:putative ABC transport system ATP-binding protein
MIRLKDVTKQFDGPKGKVTSLSDACPSLSPGELLAVNGPSGYGKTTLLLTAAGMLRPDQGWVEMDDVKSIYDLSPNQRGKLRSSLIGFVFQQFHLIPCLTVRENVMSPSLSMSRGGAAQRADELIDQFGLQERADHVPSQLGTGERQRTALARALFNQPKVILADEPTGNLDDENADLVLNHMRDHVTQGGSVLPVTHNARAAEFATPLHKLRGGRLSSQEV